MDGEDFWVGAAMGGAGLSFLLSYISYKEYRKYKWRLEAVD